MIVAMELVPNGAQVSPLLLCHVCICYKPYPNIVHCLLLHISFCIAPRFGRMYVFRSIS
jgi:hypothetical protein